MSYDPLILLEAKYVRNLGVDAVEDKFYALYNMILTHWFSVPHGYILEHQVMGPGGKPEFSIVCHNHTTKNRNAILIAEIKRPRTLHTGGKHEAHKELQDYMRCRHVDTA